MPGQSGVGHQRRVHGGVGCMQPRIPFSLHLPMAQDSPGVPTGQSGVGISQVSANLCTLMNFVLQNLKLSP